MDLEKHDLQDNTTPVNIDRQNIEYVPAKKPKYWAAFFSGLGVSVLIAIVLATISIWLEYEYTIVVFIGLGIVGGAIRHFISKPSISAAFIGLILCPLCYLLYNFIMSMFGYSYEEGSSFWFLLIGSAVYGGFMGIKDFDKED